MDETQVRDALAKIDAATTKTATNVQTISDTVSAEAVAVQTIGTEVDALQKALANALANGTGVTQALVDQAAAVSTKAQASSDALDATVKPLQDLIPVLQGIAAKGVVNGAVAEPVPVPVPPAPPATPPA